MAAEWRQRVWIVDGHNAIFALAELSALQAEGDRTGARQGLERLLASFAAQLREPLVIVYDGNRLARNPDVIRRQDLQTYFSQPPEEADDRILFLVLQAIAAGKPVTVVTNDRRTLGARLPRQARILGVEEFAARHVVSPSSTDSDDGRPRGDFSDIEQHFLSRRVEIEERAGRAGRALERRATRRWAARAGSAPPGEGAPEDDLPASRTSDSATRRRSSGPMPPPPPQRPAEEDRRGARSSDRGTREEHERRASAEAREARRARGKRKQGRRLEQMRRDASRSARPRRRRR